MAIGRIYSPHYLAHDEPSHPENAGRLRAIVQVLQEEGAWTEAVPIEAQPVDYDLLTTLHTPAYVKQVRQVSEQGGGWMDLDTYVTPDTYQTALLAAGGVVEAVAAVLAGEAETALALVRPPGHHARPGRAMGFCLFNNVALGALHALEEGRLERVLIVDWDVHHGNGTQEVFDADGRVLFFSTHQYPHYPGTGSLKETGHGDGAGTTINVPLPAGVGDTGYRRIFEEILLPAARRFEPQLILLSAGFDTHWTDPLAGMNLSVRGYAHLAALLKRLADAYCPGRLVLSLEGGYDPQALGYGILAVFRAWQGHDPATVKDPLGPARSERPADDPALDRLVETIQEAHHLNR